MSSIQSYASQNPQDNKILQVFSLSMKGLVDADADLTNINKTQAIKDAGAAQVDNQLVFSTMIKQATQDCVGYWQSFANNPTYANAQTVSNQMWPLDSFLFTQIKGRGEAALAGAIGISTGDLAKLMTSAGGGFMGSAWGNIAKVFIPAWQQNPNYVPDPNAMTECNSLAAAAQTVQWPV